MKGDFKNMHPYDKHLKAYSRRLRRNMIDAEKTLWFMIKKSPLAPLFQRGGSNRKA
jgi:very-short-patch-repair endonuclease